jgi:hypothetical protein
MKTLGRCRDSASLVALTPHERPRRPPPSASGLSLFLRPAGVAVGEIRVRVLEARH